MPNPCPPSQWRADVPAQRRHLPYTRQVLFSVSYFISVTECVEGLLKAKSRLGIFCNSHCHGVNSVSKNYSISKTKFAIAFKNFTELLPPAAIFPYKSSYSLQHRFFFFQSSRMSCTTSLSQWQVILNACPSLPVSDALDTGHTHTLTEFLKKGCLKERVTWQKQNVSKKLSKYCSCENLLWSHIESTSAVTASSKN